MGISMGRAAVYKPKDASIIRIPIEATNFLLYSAVSGLDDVDVESGLTKK
jgi:hypothetical protein